MERKTLKFRDYLAKMVQAGEKHTTWRFFDDKNLSEGDDVDLVNWNTGEKFGSAVLTAVTEKRLGEVTDADYDGHERFKSDEEMYQTYRAFYNEDIDADTKVKIIRFELKP